MAVVAGAAAGESEGCTRGKSEGLSSASLTVNSSPARQQVGWVARHDAHTTGVTISSRASLEIDIALACVGGNCASLPLNSERTETIFRDGRVRSTRAPCASPRSIIESCRGTLLRVRRLCRLCTKAVAKNRAQRRNGI